MNCGHHLYFLTLGLESFPSSADLESVSMLFWKATCNQSNMTNIKVLRILHRLYYHAYNAIPT